MLHYYYVKVMNSSSSRDQLGVTGSEEGGEFTGGALRDFLSLVETLLVRLHFVLVDRSLHRDLSHIARRSTNASPSMGGGLLL